jgi:hypothetical protein
LDGVLSSDGASVVCTTPSTYIDDGVHVVRCVLYKSFSPIARFQQLIASPFN